MAVLCRLADLEATGAKELVVEDAGLRRSVFVVRHGAGVSAYFNACPHARLPLNASPDAFFDVGRSFLFCVNHGAQFDPATGQCFRGPCKGEHLKALPVRLAGDAVVSDDPDYVPAGNSPGA